MLKTYLDYSLMSLVLFSLFHIFIKSNSFKDTHFIIFYFLLISLFIVYIFLHENI